MVNVIEDSEISMAYFYVHHYKHLDKLIFDDKFECWVDKNKTVSQFIQIVSQHYNLKVDSFSLKLKLYDSSSTFMTEIKDKLELAFNDDRPLSDLGIVFSGKIIQYHFILSENDYPEETDEARCFVRFPDDSKMIALKVDKNQKAGQLYKQVLQKCQNKGFSKNVVLIFNSSKTTGPSQSFIITEDDTRLLIDIGVVFYQGIINCFEVSFSDSSDHMYNQMLSKPCSSVQNQKTEIFRGLVNQSLTCYLNSLLQALYMTPEFRNAIYNWKYKLHESFETKSILFQLQKLFLNLQTSPMKSVETTELTKSFGWNSSEVGEQHDIQELCRIMFDALEQEFMSTTYVNLINRLYQGKMIDYVKCQECGIEKPKEIPFLDIPLSLRPIGSTVAYSSIIEALQGFVQPETLDGTNQYFCDLCNKKCNALKGLKFSKFPYILTFHLMRFNFNYLTMTRTKLCDKVTFPLQLDLNGFISNHVNSQTNENEIVHNFESVSACDDNSEMGSSLAVKEIYSNEEGIDQNRIKDKCASLHLKNESVGSFKYELYAIMIHQGNALRGHYFAYIKDFKTNKWFCFNDQLVYEISMDEIEKSFGGEITPGSSSESSSSNNAYMLMYRQIDLNRNEIPLSEEEFPFHLVKLVNSIKNKAVYLSDMSDDEENSYMVPVYLIKSGTTGMFDCNSTTTVEQLKTMAIEYFKVTEPCELIIYNKVARRVVDSVELYNKSLICHLKFQSSCLLSLQIKSRSFSPASENIIMKLFIINLNDSVENVNLSRPEEIYIDQNDLIKDVSEVVYRKYEIPEKSKLHFCVPCSSESIKLLENNTKCVSVNAYHVFVFIEHNFIKPSIVKEKMKNIFKRYDTVNNTIQLQIVFPDEKTEILQKSMMLCNMNRVEMPMPSLEDINADKLDEGNLSTKNGRLKTNPDDLCVEAISNESKNQCELSVKGFKRIILEDEDMDVDPETDFPVFENNSMDKDNTNDNDSNNIELQLNEKYTFTKLDFKPIEDNASTNNNGKLYALVDKRMTVNELKNHLISHLNIPSSSIVLNRCVSENQLEELALPNMTLEDLNNLDIINVSIGVALKDGQYRGAIFSHESPNLESPKVKVLKKEFDWIITVGTSVLDTKKELIAKLKQTKNVDIPLERCRLRKKIGAALSGCYFNEEIWNEDIGQGWEMAIIDLQDRSELEIDRTLKRLIFVKHIQNVGPQKHKIFEMEFIVDIVSTTSVSVQLVNKISLKLNIPDIQIALGWVKDGSVVWQTCVSRWKFDSSFDYDNCILYSRAFTVTDNVKIPPKQQKERSLKIGINQNYIQDIG